MDKILGQFIDWWNSTLFYDCTCVNNGGGDSIINIKKLSGQRNNDEISALLLVGLNSTFKKNTGTVLHLSNIALLGNGDASFYNNYANNGAALYLDNSYILLN